MPSNKSAGSEHNGSIVSSSSNEKKQSGGGAGSRRHKTSRKYERHHSMPTTCIPKRGMPTLFSDRILDCNENYDDNNNYCRGSDRGNSDRDANSGGGSMNGSSALETSWDDLQDEIGLAMRLSLGQNSDSKNRRDLLTSSVNTTSDVVHHSDNITNINVDNANDEEGEVGGGRPWHCVACTYVNENPFHLVCSICGTTRVASKLLHNYYSTAPQLLS